MVSVIRLSGNSNLASYFLTIVYTFPHPQLLQLSSDLPRRGGYGYFLELDITKLVHHTLYMLEHFGSEEINLCSSFKS